MDLDVLVLKPREIHGKVIGIFNPELGKGKTFPM